MGVAVQFRSVRPGRASAFGLSLVVLLGLTAPLNGAHEVPRGAETIEVRLRIIPFFAVDQDGRPVTDLRRDEVRVFLDGQEVAIAHFDRYLFAGADVDVAPTGPQSTAPRLTRQVYFLFDLAFSTQRGFRRNRRVAVRLLDRIFDTDEVYLLAFTGFGGIHQLWGPIRGRARVREALLYSLGLKKHARADAFDTIPRPPSAVGSALSAAGLLLQGLGRIEMAEIARAIGAFNREIYRRLATVWAESLQGLAHYLKLNPGPKLLFIFSQGVNSQIYFYGQPPLYPTFRRSLAELANAGVMTLFVNAVDGSFSMFDYRQGANAMRHMAHVAGGQYFGGMDMAKMEDRIVRWTTAYYEVGFYLRHIEGRGKRHRVSVRVTRPGVRIWALEHFREPRVYAQFDATERTIFVLQLLTLGPLDLKLRPTDARFHDLELTPVEERAGGTRRLRLQLPLRPDWMGHKLDVYTVVFARSAPGPMEVPFHFKRYKYRPGPGDRPLTVEFPLPDTPTATWGIVVVDRRQGDVYWHRWVYERH